MPININAVAGNITHPIHSLKIISEAMAPIKGAKLKNTPVLEDPNPFSALINNTKLMP